MILLQNEWLGNDFRLTNLYIGICQQQKMVRRKVRQGKTNTKEIT